MDEAVDAVFNLDERAEIGEVANLALHYRSYRELLVQRFPWVSLELLESQADAPIRRIDVEHNCLHLIAHIDQLRGMLHALRPRHLADVNQALNSLLQLDERAVVR